MDGLGIVGLYLIGAVVSWGIAILVAARDSTSEDRDWIAPAVIIWPFFVVILVLVGLARGGEIATDRMIEAVRNFRSRKHLGPIERDLIATIRAKNK